MDQKYHWQYLIDNINIELIKWANKESFSLLIDKDYKKYS